MKYYGLVFQFIIIFNFKLIYCGYIGLKNQKNLGNKRLATSYHNKGYIHTGSKLEPPSRPSFNWDDSQYKPYFDEVLPRNITSQLGKSAYLHCAIRELGDRTVSWVRQRDLHILTVGSYTYTSDQRFSCVNREETGTWTLEIKYVRKEDQGVYECQVSTEPKLSYSVWLNVQAAKAIIPEGPIIQLAQKSQLKLTCLLDSNYQTQSNPPSFVFWYKDGAVINYLTGRSELRIISNFIDGHNFFNKTFTSPLNKNLFSSSFFTNNYQTSSLLLRNKFFSNLDHSRLNSKRKNYISYMNYVQKQDQENKDEFFFDKENDEKLIFDQDDNHLKEKVDKKIILSVLTIDSVRSTDSGQYSCKPSYADFANVTVQVFKDDIVRSKSLFDLNHHQANNIYSTNNNEEDTKSIEFFDDEESFYIMRRSPSHNLSSNASKTLLSSLIWFDLILFKNMYCISKILMLFIIILKIFLT